MKRFLKTLTLGLVLVLAALVVPDSTVQPSDLALVKVERAAATDAPDMIWILAIGSDARPGEPVLRSHGDALQLVGLNTRTHAATTIGIPRDSWVPIPGHGHDKINASMVYGGPQLLARTVTDFIGIRPDYVMVAGFSRFMAMIDDIGGIDVHNPRRFSDPYLRRRGFDKGRVHLDGFNAMAFARIRKSLPLGDFDRSANQQRTLRGIHAKVRANADRPGFIERGVLSVMRHLTTDLSPAQLFRLAQVIAQVDPGKITSCVVPGGVGWVGPQSVVFPYFRVARRYGDDARRDAVIKRC